MQSQANLLDCYNKTAQAYADHFLDELSKKHFDRLLLRAFAAENRDNGQLIDLGCGPGQTTHYLFSRSHRFVIGVVVVLRLRRNSGSRTDCKSVRANGRTQPEKCDEKNRPRRWNELGFNP